MTEKQKIDIVKRACKELSDRMMRREIRATVALANEEVEDVPSTDSDPEAEPGKG